MFREDLVRPAGQGQLLGQFGLFFAGVLAVFALQLFEPAPVLDDALGARVGPPHRGLAAPQLFFGHEFGLLAVIFVFAAAAVIMQLFAHQLIVQSGHCCCNTVVVVVVVVTGSILTDVGLKQ